MQKIETDIIRGLVPLARQPGAIDVEIMPQNSMIGGMVDLTKRGNKPRRILIPHAENALSRTIRIHELLHARHSRYGQYAKISVCELAKQAYEDCKVHLRYWSKDIGSDLSLPINRCCLAQAKSTLHQLSVYPPTAEDWNANIVALLRSLAIVRFFRARIGNSVLARLHGALTGDIMRNAAWVVEAVERNRARIHRGAIDTIDSMMLRDDDDDQRGGGGGAQPRQAGDKVSQRIELAIVDPPKSADCDPATVSRTVLRPRGTRINFGALTDLVSRFDASRLFVNRAKRTGFAGTVLIDASSSMRVDARWLKKLCAAIPGANVMYYSSYSTNGSIGTLVIYARDGRRIADEHGAPCRGTNNDVDEAAIRYLLRQPFPLYLVSDCEFCGGLLGQDVRAAALCAANREKVRVIDSIESAWRILVGREEPAE